MAEQETNTNKQRGNSPLASLIRGRNGTQSLTTASAWDERRRNQYAGFECGPERTQTKRRHKANTTKPRARRAKGNKKSTASTLKCQCGNDIKYAHERRCEDCFADDQVRFHGRDQSATILW